VIISGCSEDKPNEPQIPPEMPPQSSFIMDFDGFQQQIQMWDDPAADLASLTLENWGWSVLSIIVWNTALTVTLAIPSAAFLASFSQEPTQQEDGSWDWTYSFTHNMIQHTAQLNGKIVNNNVEWKMFITKDGDFENFLWFTGTSDLLALEGSWTLNYSPLDPKQFMLIEWSRNVGDETAELKYTIIESGAVNEGSYIYFGSTLDIPYDHFYNIFISADNNMTNIQWNHTSKVGHVQDEKHFGNTDWYCWNEDLQDTDCPEL